MKLIIHTDGGARGNPGPAAVGVVIEQCQMPNDKCKIIKQFGKTIGETTNNVAEYIAVIEALTYLKTSHVSPLTSHDTIRFFLDSTLVVNQLNGLFKVKEGHLRELVLRVRALEQKVGGTITYQAVRREQNTRADALVNEALDTKGPVAR